MISILYVDDETALLEVTQTYLEDTGDFSVATTTSAQEAIGMLATGTFDAVVSDYQMPGMDGLAFLKHIRAENNTVPFILFTGKGREEVAIEALNTGADFYLQKGGEPKSQFAEMASKIRQAVQRRQAEQALAVSEEKYRDMVENINDVLFTVSKEGTITYISPRISQFGYTPDNVIGKTLSEFIVADDFPSVQKRFREIENGNLHPFEFRILDGAGKIRIIRTSSRPAYTGDIFSGIHGVMADITSVKTAEAKVSISEQQYCNVFEAASDAMLVLNQDTGVILDANSAALRLFGFGEGGLKGMNHADLIADAGTDTIDAETVVSGIPLRYYRKSDGTTFPTQVLESTYPKTRGTMSIISLRDISLQKQAEERVLAAQQLYAVHSQINQAIARVNDLQTLVEEICRIFVDYGHFRMAWVGLLDRELQIFRPVAHAGHEDDHPDDIEINATSDEKIQGQTGTALLDGRYAVSNDIENDSRSEQWREEAQKRGYLSSAAFPFRLHGEVVGAYMLYASRKNFFTEPGIAILEEISMDISFALDILDEQAKRTHAEKALAGSEERAGFLAEVLEHSSQPFAISYPGGGFGIVNPALCNLLGYTDSELHEKTWIGITPPEYLDREMKAIEELSQTGIPQRYETEYIRKDNSRVPVEVLIHRVVDDGGNVRLFYGFITDITERVRTQEILKTERDRAQQYLNTAAVMLAVTDPSGKITLINRKGCEILGYSEEELIGRNWLDVCLPECARVDVKRVFEQIVNGETEPAAYHENSVLTKSGEERILAFYNTAIKEADSTISGIIFSGEDITHRKQMEKEQRESEERFRNLTQNSSDMIRIIDRDGFIAYSSPSTLRITGYDPADVIGRDPFEFVDPDDRDTVRNTMDKVFSRTDPGSPTEYRIRHADGHTVDVESVALNLSDIPIINGIVTTTRPITERKMAERALRESEGRYRAIFEKSADAIFIMSDRFIDCNPAAERQFGYSRNEIIGKTPDQIFAPEQPGSTASATPAAEYIRLAHEGHVQAFRWTHRKKDGHQFPSDMTIIPARVKGKERLIAIVHDRTTQDREEWQSRHLARFAELNPDPVIEIAMDREISYANPASRTVLKAMGMPPDPAAFIPDDFDTLVSALTTGSATPVYRDVRIGTALFGVTLTYDPEDKRFRMYAREITTRAFEASALEQANRKLNLLSSITRHDIKNKLTGVMGYIELAKGSTRDPDMLEYLTRAETSATAIRLQIEFTKEYENLGVKTPVWQEISRVLEGAQKMLELDAVAVENEIPGLTVYADPMLGKVMYCLLENAAIHGEKVTKIRIHGKPSPSGFRLVVEDNGIGILPENKEKIFNKNVGKGSGRFGLFLAREILSITGITVEETGTPGTGARFEISVPIGKFHVKPT
ncbi:MAG: PAS domain S-box protein [Methanoregula sp.]|jgi:PAS domain S-box-containing protein|nr:PAS domain S-box protein [Methanoregula sp.]